jgi:hypothetical protein
MNLYKVTFSGNKAVSADQIYIPSYSATATGVATVNGQRTINWLTIYADDKRQSMKVGNKVVRDFLALLQD